MSKRFKTVDLGRREFTAVHSSMLQLLDEVHRGDSPGEIWFVEHDPIYTAGRATPPGQLRGVRIDDPSDDALAVEPTVEPTVETVAIERGGQITYHGPGQLVVYPIVPLPSRDLRRWLRAIESFGVEVCARFGLAAVASVDGTGVFVGARKVASIGVAVRHWINLHGIALNVDVDLAPFRAIRPCGLDPAIMSDLSRETGRRITLDEARTAAAASLPTLLG